MLAWSDCHSDGHSIVLCCSKHCKCCVCKMCLHCHTSRHSKLKAKVNRSLSRSLVLSSEALLESSPVLSSLLGRINMPRPDDSMDESSLEASAGEDSEGTSSGSVVKSFWFDTGADSASGAVSAEAGLLLTALVLNLTSPGLMFDWCVSV